MLLTLDLATRGFVSTLEEEEYELTKILTRETDTELEDDEDEENEENKKRYFPPYSEEDREIFDDEEDTFIISEYY